MTPGLPNTFIAGAQKSGTTTLHRLLESHPEAYTPPEHEEIHYFDLPASFARGLAEYRSLFRGWRGEPVLFQTSPLYLYLPEVPPRIAEVCPEARLIFILRHPADRAYSHYWHEIRFGWEDLSFEQALEGEAERLRGGFDAVRHYSYIDRGRYARQLARYIELFGRERILVLLTDELREDLAGTARRLGDFLGLDTEGWLGEVLRRPWRHNRNRLPRSRALQRRVRNLRERWPRLGYLVDLLNLTDASYPPMAAETRRRLEALFAPEIDALEPLLDRDLGCWRTPAGGGA